MKPRYFTDGREYWQFDGIAVRYLDCGSWEDSMFCCIDELLACINVREITEEELP